MSVIGFPLILALIGLAAAASGLAWLLKRRSAARQAGEVYEDWTRESPHALRGLSEERFRIAYLRVHGGRSRGALALALLTVLVTTPLTLLAMRGLLYWRWVSAGRPADMEEGGLMWNFAGYFLLVAIWAGIVAIAAHLYHRRAAGSLQHEILVESARKDR